MYQAVVNMESQEIPFRLRNKVTELTSVRMETPRATSPLKTTVTDTTSKKGNDDHGAHTTSFARAPMVGAATQTDVDVHVNHATSHVRAPMIDATAQTDVNVNV